MKVHIFISVYRRVGSNEGPKSGAASWKWTDIYECTGGAAGGNREGRGRRGKQAFGQIWR